MTTPLNIAESIADAGALVDLERKSVISVAARAIRQERQGAVKLTPSEAKAVLEAIGQMTEGNARDYESWRAQTSGTLREWHALLAAEAKIKAVWK